MKRYLKTVLPFFVLLAFFGLGSRLLFAEPNSVSTAAPVDAVCKIGTTTYPSLQDAIKAAKPREKTTIVLLKNIDATSLQNQQQHHVFEIGNNKDIVLKDNGSPVTIDVSDQLLKNTVDNAHNNYNLYLDLFKVAAGAALTFDGPQITVNSKASKDRQGLENIIFNEGTVTINAGVFNGGNLRGQYSGVIYSEASYTDATKAVCNINGGTIQNAVLNPYKGDNNNVIGSVVLVGWAELNMSGGTIQNGVLNRGGSLGATAGVCIAKLAVNADNIAGKNTTMNMTGGTISNCIGIAGGGVTLYSPDNWSNKDNKVIFTMKDGTITGNAALFAGGGVAVTGNAIFNMSGGEISHNNAGPSTGVFDDKYFINNNQDISAKQTFKDNFPLSVQLGWAQGGGVAVGLPYTAMLPNPSINNAAGSTDTLGVFNFSGGKIDNNTADLCGGGVYVNTSNVNLTAGKITNNTASFHGGGVYVSSVPKVLHVQNAVISENVATPLSTEIGVPLKLATAHAKKTTAMGGGLWLCPTGTINVKLDHGIAIFDNKAQTTAAGELAAGDDIATVLGKTQSTISIPDRALGGGLVAYYKDGGIVTGPVGAATDAPRYNSENPGEPLSFEGRKENVAAITVTSEAAKTVARNQAKLFITHNKASHGGGIGTNGDITLVGMDVHDPIEKKWTLNVTKQWDSSVTKDQQKTVTVYLKIDGVVLDSVELNQQNNWTASFKSIPDSIKNKVTVVEGNNNNGVFTDSLLWDYKVSDPLYNEANNSINIVITNKPRPLLQIPVEVKWVDDQGNDVSTLLKNTKVQFEILSKLEGSQNASLVSLNNNVELSNSTWTYTWKDLPEFSRTLKDGIENATSNDSYKKYLYTVREINSDGKPIESELAFWNVVAPISDAANHNAIYRLNDKTKFMVSYSYDAEKQVLLVVNTLIKSHTSDEPTHPANPGDSESSSQVKPHPQVRKTNKNRSLAATGDQMPQALYGVMCAMALALIVTSMVVRKISK